MTLPPDIREELERLLAAQTTGELTETEFEQLAALLRQSPEARGLYVAHLMLEAQLEQEHLPPLTVPIEAQPVGVQPSGCESADKNVRPTAKSPTSAPTRRSAAAIWLRDLSHEYSRQPLALAILVMAMAFGGILAWKFSTMPQQQMASGGRQPPVLPAPATAQSQQGADAPGSPDLAPGSPEGSRASTPAQPKVIEAKSRTAIARLARTVGASWDAPDTIADGESLAANQKLSLKQGLAEIAFESGATVILEGPAELEVGGQGSGVGGQESGVGGRGSGVGDRGAEQRGDNSCSLIIGKLVARVPQQAHGFTVHTPTLTIVDLGTEFGVTVQAAKNLPPDSRLPTPDSRLLTPDSRLLTPDSRLLTPVLTEVHVLRGEISITPVSEALAQVPAEKPSTILKAGEGVISTPGDGPPRAIKAEPTKFVRELPPEGVAHASPKRERGPLHPGDILAVSRKTLKLVKIDPRTGEQTLLAQGNREIHGTDWMCAAVDGEGNVLVGTDMPPKGPSGLVLKINPADGAIQVLAQGGLLNKDRVSGLAIAADGSIWATLDGGEDKVLKINPRSGDASKIATFGNNAWGIAVDPVGGDLLVASDGGPGQIGRIQGQDVSLAAEGEEITGARGIAVRPDGRIFVSVTQGTSGRIVEVDRATRRMTDVVNVPAQPGLVLGMLAVDPSGWLLVANGVRNSTVYRMDADRRTIAPVASGGHLEEIIGLAVVPQQSP